MSEHRKRHIKNKVADKDDELKLDVISVPWLPDMICTFIFLVEIGMLLRHAHSRSQKKGEEMVLWEIVFGTLAMFAAIYVCKFEAMLHAKYFSKHYVKEDPMRRPILVRKISDQFWQLVVHVSMTIFELVILAQNGYSWLADPDQSWTPPPWKQNKEYQGEDFDEWTGWLVQKFYISQLCIWIATGISHKFLEEKHKDYFVMYIHHIATLGLVFGSWTVDYTRIGVLVLFTHDASDISIDLLKLTNNLKLHEAEWFYCCEICFVLVLVSWAWARGWYLATKLIPSTAFGCVRAILDHEYEDETEKYSAFDFLSSEKDVNSYTPNELMQVGNSYDLYATMNVLLTSILCMNIWWYYLLVSILAGKCKGEASKDVGKRVYEGTDGKEQ